MSAPDTLAIAVDRHLLRQAGEHVGTLAEEARAVHQRYAGQRGASWTAKKFYDRYVRLATLSRQLLELANAD